jgi:hypothetical protein
MCEVSRNCVNKGDKYFVFFKRLRTNFTEKLRARILESVKMQRSLKLCEYSLTKTIERDWPVSGSALSV